MKACSMYFSSDATYPTKNWKSACFSLQTHGGTMLSSIRSDLVTHLLQLAVNMLDNQINGHHIPTTLEGTKSREQPVLTNMSKHFSLGGL